MKLDTIPKADFHDLETLWFQVSGTLCNLRCTHCFISCSPDNHNLEMMDTETVLAHLEKARKLRVREIYFTGGEPFLHRDMTLILERTLRDFPVSVLTNGLPINDARADEILRISADSRYSLEIRISLDDFDEQRNDAVRGKGVFRRALAAYKRLSDRGLVPILTVTEIRDYLGHRESVLNPYQKYIDLLYSVGVTRPRVKIIPVFEMGMLPTPNRPAYVSSAMMKDFDHSHLQCSSSRMVAADGIYACPILVGEEEARMSETSLEETMKPCSLYHSACTTCYVTGMTCRNY